MSLFSWTWTARGLWAGPADKVKIVSLVHGPYHCAKFSHINLCKVIAQLFPHRARTLLTRVLVELAVPKME
jgi:hypothetical protein